MKGRNNSRGLASLLQEFDTVSLQELSGNPLMDRYDEKYLLPVSEYKWLLPELFSHYRILEVGGIRNYPYVSTYLDTAGRQMYLDHQNGKKERYKIRFRRYVHSDKVYLEVKHKINKGKTLKKRLERLGEEDRLSQESQEFIRIHSPFKADQLHTVLQVGFSRITLADPIGEERFTFDFRLRFTGNDTEKSLPETGVLEVKHSGRKSHSLISSLLTRYHSFPTRFSKYCTGMILLYPGLKYNRFKPLLLTLNKIHHGNLPTTVAY